jgi:hypothetical protein
MKAALLLLVTLAGCAHASYTAQAPTEPQDQALKECRSQSFARYYASRNDGAGVLVGGIVLGPVGAVVGGEIAASSGALTPHDLPRMTEACMAGKGYFANSDNVP